MITVCGILGFVAADNDSRLSDAQIKFLVSKSKRRGSDSSGIIYRAKSGSFKVIRADFDLERLLRNAKDGKSSTFFAHSRLITNGMKSNQPASSGSTFVLHNGIIVDPTRLWNEVARSPESDLDSEAIAAFADRYIEIHGSLSGVWNKMIPHLLGAASCIVINPRLGEAVAFSNTGSLFLGKLPQGYIIASEAHTLEKLGAADIQQIRDERLFHFEAVREIDVTNHEVKRPSFLPLITEILEEERQLEYRPNLSERCVKCVLPVTMPFIEFDGQGVCNYCRNYVPKNTKGSLDDLRELVHPYRKPKGPEVIVPFSGGRDSTYALKLIVEDLGLRAISYTYDWGMITDLGRRNISLMTSRYGVENIVVASDVARKRRNIRKNLNAWLQKPHLGMLSLLTAGDKHFYKYLGHIQKETAVKLNLWGINPWETTHFKAGFLGVAPNFSEQTVYRSGLQAQLNYQRLRFGQMVRNPSYLNDSIFDTISGEYYRSVKKKEDYFHVFDFFNWNERQIDAYLTEVGWERATDTSTTWRIGDGTAGFYNYAYRTVAGFSEHDTFRSNQIREGQISRAEALALLVEDNRPRYQNIKWYLEAVGVGFKDAVSVINSMSKLYLADSPA